MTADPNAPALSQVGFEDSLQHWGTDAATGSSWGVEGRAAAFVKGTIGNDVLLTGSFDTNKINQERFFSDIDPNQYFPITGDASLINYDARSTSKLYLRLDKDQSHVLYGDFQTVAPTDTAWLGQLCAHAHGIHGPLRKSVGQSEYLRCHGVGASIRRRTVGPGHFWTLCGIAGQRRRQLGNRRDLGARTATNRPWC